MAQPSTTLKITTERLPVSRGFGGDAGVVVVRCGICGAYLGTLTGGSILNLIPCFKRMEAEAEIRLSNEGGERWARNQREATNGYGESRRQAIERHKTGKQTAGKRDARAVAYRPLVPLSDELRAAHEKGVKPNATVPSGSAPTMFLTETNFPFEMPANLPVRCFCGALNAVPGLP